MSNTKKKAYGSYEIAKLCQVTPGTVNTWFKQKRIPTFRTAGGHFRAWNSDVAKLMKSMGLPVPPELIREIKTRYLIVDDDAIIRRLVRRLLESNDPRAEIFEAVDGYEAGFKTTQLKPDLVILDFRLPCLDGLKVCGMIRSEKETNKMKILAVSGDEAEKTKRVFIKAGADAFLSKPFDNKEFIQIVNSLVPKPD